MNYKKMVDNRVVSTFADGVTFNRTDGKTDIYASTEVYVGDDLVLKLFVGNNDGFEGKKRLTINKQVLKDLGIDLVVN